MFRQDNLKVLVVRISWICWIGWFFQVWSRRLHYLDSKGQYQCEMASCMTQLARLWVYGRSSRRSSLKCQNEWPKAAFASHTRVDVCTLSYHYTGLQWGYRSHEPLDRWKQSLHDHDHGHQMIRFEECFSYGLQYLDSIIYVPDRWQGWYYRANRGKNFPFR